MLSSWTLDNTEYFGSNFEPEEEEEIHILVELPPYGVRRNPLRISIGQEYIDDLRPYQVTAERLGDHVDVRKRHSRSLFVKAVLEYAQINPYTGDNVLRYFTEMVDHLKPRLLSLNKQSEDFELRPFDLILCASFAPTHNQANLLHELGVYMSSASANFDNLYRTAHADRIDFRIAFNLVSAECKNYSSGLSLPVLQQTLECIPDESTAHLVVTKTIQESFFATESFATFSREHDWQGVSFYRISKGSGLQEIQETEAQRGSSSANTNIGKLVLFVEFGQDLWE